jgi:hypothetical protein
MFLLFSRANIVLQVKEKTNKGNKMSSERATGVTVTVIERGSIDEGGTMPNQMTTLLQDFGVLGMARDSNGQRYYLCSEGVGWCTEEHWEDYIGNAVTKEEDLSTFIRTFGARLEGNFYQWYTRLSV